MEGEIDRLRNRHYRDWDGRIKRLEFAGHCKLGIKGKCSVKIT